MGRIEQEIVISGEVKAVADGVATAKLEARAGRRSPDPQRHRRAARRLSTYAPLLESLGVLSERQELVLQRVVEEYLDGGAPVGSKALSAGFAWGPSTIRHELASLEELGLLQHPHTSAGRVPTESGYRYFVDRLLPAKVDSPPLALSLVRREVDEAMRVTTETLSQVTNLLAIVTAPPIDTATIRHIEVLTLAAAGADGRRDHLHRRRQQAHVHVRLGRSTRDWPTGPPAT